MLLWCYKVPPLGGGDRRATRDQRLLLTWWVISCIWEKASRSLLMRLAIFEVACMTVEWSRPPNAFPILGKDSSVSSRERYMATWRGEGDPLERLWPTRAAFETPKYRHTS